MLVTNGKFYRLNYFVQNYIALYPTDKHKKINAYESILTGKINFLVKIVLGNLPKAKYIHWMYDFNFKNIITEILGK